jgi:hypothetical protein
MSAHKIRSACWPFLIIVHGRKLVLRANAKKVFLTNRPSRWLALYGYLQNFPVCTCVRFRPRRAPMTDLSMVYPQVRVLFVLPCGRVGTLERKPVKVARSRRTQMNRNDLKNCLGWTGTRYRGTCRARHVASGAISCCTGMISVFATTMCFVFVRRCTHSAGWAPSSLRTSGARAHGGDFPIVVTRGMNVAAQLLLYATNPNSQQRMVQSPRMERAFPHIP